MLNYCLTALAVILISALIAYFVIRKKKLDDKKNRINLVICTVLAIVCSTLTPLLANLMVKELYFSIFLSVFISFVLMVVLSYTAFILSQRFLKKDGEKEEVEPELSNPAVEAMPEFGSIAGLDAAAVVNEAAIISKVEGFENEDDDLVISGSEPLQLDELIELAMESKKMHNFSDAIFSFENALRLNPEVDLLTWIVIDLCSLYKRTGQKALAYKLLESAQCFMLDYKIKENILQNL